MMPNWRLSLRCLLVIVVFSGAWLCGLRLLVCWMRDCGCIVLCCMWGCIKLEFCFVFWGVVVYGLFCFILD